MTYRIERASLKAGLLFSLSLIFAGCFHGGPGNGGVVDVPRPGQTVEDYLLEGHAIQTWLGEVRRVVPVNGVAADQSSTGLPFVSGDETQRHVAAYYVEGDIGSAIVYLSAKEKSGVTTVEGFRIDFLTYSPPAATSVGGS